MSRTDSAAYDPIIEGVRRHGNVRSGGSVRCRMQKVVVRGHHALQDVAVLGAVNARRCAPPDTRPSGIDGVSARRTLAAIRWPGYLLASPVACTVPCSMRLTCTM